METTKHSHSKCCRSTATTGKGRWRTRGNWRVIGGVMWESLCGAGKIQMQFQFSRVSKNLNKTKGTYRTKHSRWSAATRGIGWWRARGDWSVIDGEMGDYLHGGGTNRIYLIGQIESEEKNLNKGNSQDKKLPSIRGNNRHRMVPGAWRFDMSWWRNGWFTESGIPWWFIWLWAGEMRDSCSAHLWEEQSTTSHASEYGTEGQTMFWIPNRGYGLLL